MCQWHMFSTDRSRAEMREHVVRSNPVSVGCQKFDAPILYYIESGEFMTEKEEMCCESTEVHEELLRSVNETLPDETELYDLAELFKVFGDSTRIRILYGLFEAEVCVCDLAAALNMTQSAISHQLKILKQNRLIKSRREGKSVFYSLADDHVRAIIAQGQEHIEE